MEAAHSYNVLAHTGNTNGRLDHLRQILDRVRRQCGTARALRAAASAPSRPLPQGLELRFCRVFAPLLGSEQCIPPVEALRRAPAPAPLWEFGIRTSVRAAFSLDSPTGDALRSLWPAMSQRHWPGDGSGPRRLFVDRAFAAAGFVGAWDAVHVTAAGASHTAIGWATPFNPDYTRRGEPRHDTWELRTDTGDLRVAVLVLLFRYKNQGACPAPGPSGGGAAAVSDASSGTGADAVASHGASGRAAAGGVHDLALVRWLELNDVDTATAAEFNGTTTFEVRRPALLEIVPVRWLVRARLVVPCGRTSRLRGAKWVWLG